LTERWKRLIQIQGDEPLPHCVRKIKSTLYPVMPEIIFEM